MTDIELGYDVETGERVDVPITHTFVSGITRHGKSEATKALASRAASEGYTVLAFDVKTPRDYDDLGEQIPVYIDEATNPTTLKGLLESQGGMSLSFQYSELIKVCEQDDTYQGVLDRMGAMLDEDRHPVEEDKLRVLHHLLSELVAGLDAIDIDDQFALPHRVNVMDLHDVDAAIQQLAVASSVEWVTRHAENVIVVIDEAHNFIPQRAKPPANEPINRAIREGGAKNLWLWLADQTITGIDKDPLKQVDLWLLGRQREKNEADRVLDQIPGRTAHDSEDVMTLDKGRFITALDAGVPTVYARPEWVDANTASRIATGELDVTLPTKDIDMEDLEDELAAKDDRIRELEAQLQERADEIDRLNQLLEERDERGGDGITVPDEPPDPADFPALVTADGVREIVEEHVEALEIPDAIEIDRAVPEIRVVERIEPVELDQSTLVGKIATLYVDGDLPEDTWITTSRFTTLMQERGWDEDAARRGDEIDRLCHWGIFRKQYAGNRPEWKIDLPVSDARDRGLIDVETAEA